MERQPLVAGPRYRKNFVFRIITESKSYSIGFGKGLLFRTYYAEWVRNIQEKLSKPPELTF